MRLIAALAMLTTATISASATDVLVYFGTTGRETKGIYRATLNTESGKLGPAELAAEIGSPGFLALHPDGDRLYAAGRLDNDAVVAGYRIGDQGTLTHFTTSPVGDGGATHLTVHPSGTFLLTAQYGGGSAALFPLDRDGKLGPATLNEHEGGSQVVAGRQDSPHPHWTGFSADGRFAFVPDLGLDGIVIYAVDAAAPAVRKHGIAESVPGGGPRHMRFSADGRFIYLLNELSLSVTTFAYDAQAGTTERRSTTPTLSEQVKAQEGFNSAAEILVHPGGRFVYSSNRGHDSVTAYRADPATGRLDVIEVEPIRGSWPRNIAMDRAGRWLLAAGAHSNTVAVFAIDPETGSLTFQGRNIINVPGPICVLIKE